MRTTLTLDKDVFAVGQTRTQASGKGIPVIQVAVNAAKIPNNHALEFLAEERDEAGPHHQRGLPARCNRSDSCLKWTRAEFHGRANRVAARFGYRVRFLPVGPEDALVGAPTQMGVFERA